MTVFVISIHIFVCIFLIAVILLQAGRGQGLSWGTFGGTPQSILGTRTASFFARLTTGCAIVFLFTCIALNIFETRKSRSLLSALKAPGQIDLAKIKEALKEVREDKTQKANSVQAVSAVNPTPKLADQSDASSVKPSTTQPVQSAADTHVIPSPDKQSKKE